MKNAVPSLSRRERQIMDVLHAQGRATAQTVRAQLADPPSYSAVRALLAVLEQKGHVRHEQDGPRYVYVPAVSKERASRGAVAHLLEVFFDGSAERAVAALLDVAEPKLTDAELERLAALVERTKKEGR